MPDHAAHDISPSLDDICARTEALVEGFRERAPATEANRVLPRETVDELYDAELLQLFAPKRYGGLSLDWPAIVHASRIAARGCASTGWLVSVVGGHIAIVSRLPKACQDEVFKDGVRKIITTASAQTTGTITKEKDGYRLKGVWRFGSGIDHADYVMVTGRCDNHPNPPEPNVFRATVPRRAVEVDAYAVPFVDQLHWSRSMIPGRWRGCGAQAPKICGSKTCLSPTNGWSPRPSALACIPPGPR